MTVAAEDNVPLVREQAGDLTFLATGEYQHAFVRRDEPDDWIYKIPAAFGYLLPFQQPFRFFWPSSAYEKSLQLACLELPAAFQRKVSQRLAARLAGSRFHRCQPVLAPLQLLSSGCRAAGQQVVAAYCRRQRRRHFDRMLETVNYIGALGLSRLLLPHCIVRDARARLHLEGKSIPYCGPLLIQRRAALLEDGLDLDAFSWQEIIDAQHCLWRHGLGVSGCVEMLGARSWAIWEGRIYLADTSSLSRDAELIRENLKRDHLEAATAGMLRRLRELGCGDSADTYLRTMRSEINLERFDQLWCAGSNLHTRPQVWQDTASTPITTD